MYFTQLPDPTDPGFDEQVHYSRFKKQNIIFNAASDQSYCHEHVGCLSLKTVLHGEESYTVDHQRLVLRPGHFLILNDDQTYSSQIERGEHTRIVSVFFQKEFAASVFADAGQTDDARLDDPFRPDTAVPEFFVKLHTAGSDFARWISSFTHRLDTLGYDPGRTTEELVSLLQHLLGTYRTETRLRDQVSAVKPGTKKEIFRRLCIARDLLHSSFADSLELPMLAVEARLSVPQLIRQFKNVFGVTPHQYLVTIRLGQAAAWLRETTWPVGEIAWRCGFNDVSAYCRAFKGVYGMSAEEYRNTYF